MTLAIGGWKGWLLVVTIRTMLFPATSGQRSSQTGFKWTSEVHPWPLCGRIFPKKTEWKVVSAEILFALFYVWVSSSSPETYWPLSLTSFSSLLRVPYSSGKGAGRKMNWGNLAWLCLEIYFFSWSPVKREQKQNKKANIANSAHFFISEDLKILWYYWAENHSYNKVEMIPSGKTGQLYHYCCWAESSERPLHHQLEQLQRL